MGIFSEILQIIQLAPAILQLITQLETIFAGQPKTGAAKKAIVMNTLSTAGLPPVTTQALGSFVDSTVSTLNSAGVFKKTN